MIALVTCASARALDTDLPLLVDALDDIGVGAGVVAWDEPAPDWTQFDAVVLRSPWNYHERRDDFLAWVRAVHAVTPVFNPPELVAANTDKRYLADLAAAGLAIVPTVLVAPGATVDLDALDADVVVKPTVGAGSNGVERFVERPDAARDHIATLHRDGHTAMVQPYLDAVDADGETGLVYVGGRFSHAFRKDAILRDGPDFATGLYAEETISPTVPTDAERRLADRVVAHVGATAYARVDLLPTPDGPVVLELELTEPSLFLHTDPVAPRRAAEAFAALPAVTR